MEDYKIDIVLGQGPAARTIRLDLPRFTLVGATTRPGLITGPMRSRFGIIEHLEYYRDEELAEGVRRDAQAAGRPRSSRRRALEIGRRARGTMRIAKRLLRRVRDFADVAGERAIDARRGCAPRSTSSASTPQGSTAATAPSCGRSSSVRGRPGRPRHAGDVGGRGPRDARGGARAVPHPARPAAAHLARPRRDARAYDAPRPAAPAAAHAGGLFTDEVPAEGAG
jgi:hypothetical protein